MARIDLIKEKINYLKVWLGISVVTLISLLGWLSSNFDELSTVRSIISLIGVAWLVALVHFLNKSILNKINSLEEL
ncbi:MAG: hypothetical protein L3J19_04005 [Sulfurimonas sp.]|nr:hypothetical protein [Sulfurimonas sp.]